ncbi:unnamed protein product [Vitrella brassicaformis CCMP3155]|uniref:Exportin-T n=2 Tax=Vitrella brassicaformis TaxID=1169539 RepID=A0A0G4FFT7_VITBC|nr:unnamed protein product [Vitrella brassicaformis CCMP3155]|eukprot:CEM12082.1 unnamed protein product [Vitrella brassicaformis CCMP3155]
MPLQRQSPLLTVGYAFKRSPPESTWRPCMEWFLSPTGPIALRFWAVKALMEVLPRLYTGSRHGIIPLLLQYLQTQCGGDGRMDESTMVNQACVLYVKLMRVEYPERWGSAVDDMLQLGARGLRGGEICAKLLVVVDEEIVSDELHPTQEERQRSSHVKAAMRANDIAKIVSWCYELLRQPPSPPLAPLHLTCLKVLGLYFPWIDLSAIVNPSMPLLALLLARVRQSAEGAGEKGESQCGVWDGETAAEACDAISAVRGRVVKKKMPAASKLSLLTDGSLQLTPTMEGAIHRLWQRQGHHPQQHLELLGGLGELCNAVGEEVLDCLAAMHKDNNINAGFQGVTECWQLLERMVNTASFVFGHESSRVSESVEAFLSDFVGKVKALMAMAQQQQQGAPTLQQQTNHAVSVEQLHPLFLGLLRGIAHKVSYPPWYDFCIAADDDDRHLEFLRFRKEVTKLFQRIATLDEMLVWEFLRAAVDELCAALSAHTAAAGTSSPPPLPWNRVEAILYLLFVAGEKNRGIPQALKVPPENAPPPHPSPHPLRVSLTRIYSCPPLLAFPHHAVRTHVLEMLVRYSAFFLPPKRGRAEEGSFFLVGLQLLLDERGIRNADQRTPPLAASVLQKYVKAHLNGAVAYTQQIYEGIRPFLTLPYVPFTASEEGQRAAWGLLHPDDRTHLFETLGLLIGGLTRSLTAGDVDAAKQSYLQSAIAPLLGPMKDPQLAAEALADREGHAEWIARAIQAMGCISKGFSKPVPVLNEVWRSALDGVTTAMKLFGGFPRVRRYSLFFCRRMVTLMSGGLLMSSLASMLTLFYAQHNLGLEEINDLAIFVGHIAATLVGDPQVPAEGFLECVTPGFFDVHYRVWQQLPDGSAEMRREKSEVQSQMFHTFYLIAQRSPHTLLKLLAKDNADTDATQQPFRDRFVHLSVEGAVNVRSGMGLVYLLQMWCLLVECLLQTSPQETHQVLSVLQESLSRVVHGFAEGLFMLDTQDPTDLRALNEMCRLFRTLVCPSGSFAALSASQQGHLKAMMHSGIRSALRGKLQGDKSCQAMADNLVQALHSPPGQSAAVRDTFRSAIREVRQSQPT